MTKSRSNYQRVYMLLENTLQLSRLETTTLVHRYLNCNNRSKYRVLLEHARQYSVLQKISDQVKHMDLLVIVSD